ncbi:beta-1,6-N-acetylglucosaminyltransferase [Paraclostridium sordellii]|uniref:beta-1,6-N-acetylglucosaminyltransferase n=1 Tax=Paraclostridium sordellii TaxID=1505 RepID=UPI0005E94090|nr:beta-1,6-N-acetylglucosaminyltransferase [Paeniclostridium sordellii]MDU7966804.1 beta-1,6-N-acetylglucosaminyltransferase [Paeniclostridium sordellii]CEN89679.1 Core-2/I-Branching enzyme [[Clostridium] sordellii] [Paeniclostridium sordellii]CEQ13329.1 Core-2/I-Branching enzyme [[Clostridium] sordellii] [Paeniclostridium sordellii]
MKVAYCVQCHKNSKILREFIRVFYNKNDIYIHVDKKANIDDFKEYKSKVTFVDDRVNVTWAGVSQIKSTINTLKLVDKKKYDYVFLVSGDCLPLKSDKNIKEFLKNRKGKEFIGIEKDFDQILVDDRLKYKYPHIYYKKDKTKLDKLYILIREKFNLNKKNEYFKELPKLYKGCNWFGLTGEACSYVLKYIDENKNYLKAFKNSIYGDEVFFQTIIMNSKYKEKIYNYEIEDDDNKMALRYIDWETGPEFPKILNEKDFDKIKKSQCIIGRKFDDDLNIDKYRETFKIYEL